MVFLRSSRPPRPSHPRGSRTLRSRLVPLAVATALLPLTSAFLPVSATAAPAPRQAGPTLVSETFTGATADPEFVAVGTACLTGAPQSAAPGPGNHPLTGCPPNSVGPVPPDNAAPHGYLRLTGASNDESGAVLYNQAIPSQAGLDITFEQWQYGSTTPNTPADGISFFLVDGAASLEHPGAFGGSLGYAQKLPDDNPSQAFVPGVDRGYLGVGLDVLGNYFGDWEHRSNGCPAGQRSPAGTGFRAPAPGPNMVTLRGPGDGITGYCFLTATTSNFTTTGPWPSTLPGTLQGPTTTLPPGVTPQQAEALLDPSRRTVHIVLTPSPNPRLTVDIDFHDGNGSRQVISTDAPQPVPDSYKFGFAASTGLFTDVHLIRNLAVNPEQPLPALSLVKQVRQTPPLPSPLFPGAQVPYEYVVTNSGNTRLTNVHVTDDKVSPITCPETVLDPGKSTTCTGTYTVTAADAAAGHITNVATAHGNSGDTQVDSNPDTQTLPVAVRALGLVKNVDTSRTYAPGDVVTYTYTVTNNGGTILDGVHVVDDRVAGITCEHVSLAPGASTTCTGTYTVTAADAAAGRVVNVATALADEDAVSSEPDTKTITTATPALHLVKSVDSSHPYAVGDVVTYTYTVNNTGGTPITGLHISDDKVTNIVCQATSLAPGASTTCSGTYTVTAADAAAGHVTNTARALADGGVVSEQDTATIIVGTPAMHLVKSVDNSHAYQAGDVVTYTYTVNNTGGTPITGLHISDDKVTNIVCQATSLAPGASTTCSGTYTVTAADAAAGHVTNTAMALADGGVVSEQDTATIAVVAPGLHLVKSVDNSHPYQAGDVVTYTYTVTNTGGTTLNSLHIVDDRVTGITCQATTLAPGGSTTCTGTYTVTAADAAAGYVTNIATALANGDTVVSEPGTATITTGTPALFLVKSVDSSHAYLVGETVTYTYTVTNTGGVAVNGLHIVDDRVTNITCEAAALAPGESTTCTGTYTVTAADAAAGQITNRATARGNDGSVVSPPATATVDVGTSALHLVKHVDASRTYAAGDVVTYTYTVTNTGTTTVTGTRINDDRVTGVTCEATSLAPGASTTCTGRYTVTEADVRAGRVTNTATALGNDDTLVSEPASATITLCPPPKPPCPPKECPPKDCPSKPDHPSKPDCPSKPDHPSKPDCPSDDDHQGW